MANSLLPFHSSYHVFTLVPPTNKPVTHTVGDPMFPDTAALLQPIAFSCSHYFSKIAPRACLCVCWCTKTNKKKKAEGRVCVCLSVTACVCVFVMCCAVKCWMRLNSSGKPSKLLLSMRFTAGMFKHN